MNHGSKQVFISRNLELLTKIVILFLLPVVWAIIITIAVDPVHKKLSSLPGIVGLFIGALTPAPGYQLFQIWVAD
jgi:hypothetical protein